MNEATPGRVANLPGVYRHQGAGVELIVMPDPTTTAKQDALVRMGYTYVGPPPTREEVAKMQADQLAKDLEDEKNGVVAAPYAVPGEQEVIFNGSVTDKGGPADELASAQAERDMLREKVTALEALTGAEAESPKEDQAAAEQTNEEGR